MAQVESPEAVSGDASAASAITGTSLRTERPSWETLYRIGGVAALLAAAATAIAIAVFIAWPPPYDGTVADWFALYRENPLLGMVSLDLLLVVTYALLIPVVLAECVALRRTSASWTAVAAGLFFVAVVSFMASNPSVEMLSLSNQHAAAATAGERAALVGAAEAVLAGFEGTAFHVNYILGQAAGIIIGAVMLRSHLFSKTIAYLAIVGNAIGFGLYIPTVGLALSAFSGVVLWVWFILIGRRLLQLARQE
jgi:hypothetical protein